MRASLAGLFFFQCQLQLVDCRSVKSSYLRDSPIWKDRCCRPRSSEVLQRGEGILVNVMKNPKWLLFMHTFKIGGTGWFVKMTCSFRNKQGIAAGSLVVSLYGSMDIVTISGPNQIGHQLDDAFDPFLSRPRGEERVFIKIFDHCSGVGWSLHTKM